jgi:ribosomal protein S18 acetylase RimI-like enzyme
MATSRRDPERSGCVASHALRSIGGAIQLRPETDADGDFTRALFVSTRWDELAVAAWPESTKLAFLHDQFRLQRAHYRSAYHDAAFQLILAEDEPIGRLYLHRGATDYRIVDISLLPQWRRRGVGEYLLHSVQVEAGSRHCKVSVHVEINNPAQRLYARLGFRPVEDKGIYLLLEWRGWNGALN